MDRLFVNPKYQQTWAAIGLKSIAEVVANFLPDYKKRRKVTVRKIALQDGKASINAFLKYYHHREGGWRFWLRRSKARTEFENYMTFERVGVPAAEAIACGEDRDVFGRLHQSFILTRAVPDCRGLDEHFEGRCPWPERRMLIQQLAEVLHQLHGRSFFYYDLVWRNILVSKGKTEKANLFLIDCPRGGTARLWQARKRLRDLASLDKSAVQLCSRAERLRFLLKYLGKSRVDPEVRSLVHQCIDYRRTRWPEDWRGR